MATVVSCTLDRETASASVDERNRGTYQLRWIVKTNGKMSSRAVAQGALTASPHPLPSQWATFAYQGDTDPYSYARPYLVTPDPKSVVLYYIDVTYSPLEPGEAPGIANVTPTLRPAIADWDTEVYTDYVDRDISGNEIVNKCGKRYDDPIEVERTRGVLVVEFNVATLAAVIAHNLTFELATNSSGFTIFGTAIGERQAFCRSVQSQRQQTEGGTIYYTEIYRIVFKKPGETWLRGIAERGFQHFKKDDHGNFERAPNNDKQLFDGTDADDGGIEYAEPVRLAADGTKLPDDEPGIFTDWFIEKEANFNNLPFL